MSETQSQSLTEEGLQVGALGKLSGGEKGVPHGLEWREARVVKHKYRAWVSPTPQHTHTYTHTHARHILSQRRGLVYMSVLCVVPYERYVRAPGVDSCAGRRPRRQVCVPHQCAAGQNEPQGAQIRTLEPAVRIRPKTRSCWSTKQAETKGALYPMLGLAKNKLYALAEHGRQVFKTRSRVGVQLGVHTHQPQLRVAQQHEESRVTCGPTTST